MHLMFLFCPYFSHPLFSTQPGRVTIGRHSLQIKWPFIHIGTRDRSSDVFILIGQWVPPYTWSCPYRPAASALSMLLLACTCDQALYIRLLKSASLARFSNWMIGRMQWQSKYQICLFSTRVPNCVKLLKTSSSKVQSLKKKLSKIYFWQHQVPEIATTISRDAFALCIWFHPVMLTTTHCRH